MHLIVNHKMLVQNPNEMYLDKQSGQRMCPKCDLPFKGCFCPKPWSTLETDGYEIVHEDNVLVAYPTMQVYEELMLWVFRNKDYLICAHCQDSVQMEWGMNQEASEVLVEQFFAIHQDCYTGENVEYFLSPDQEDSDETD